MNLSLAAAALSPRDITTVLAALAVMLVTARLLGELARRVGQPAVLGEILAGIVLGPTILGVISPNLFASLFPTEGAAALGLEFFIALAVTLMLLAAGLEVDLSSALKQGKSTLLVSVTGIVFPFALGAGMAWLMPGELGLHDESLLTPFALFFGVALSITALPVIAKILIDLNILKSDMGMLIMSSAMINDLLGWIGFAMILAMLPQTGEAVTGGLMQTIGMTLVFLAVMLTGARWAANRVLPFVQAHFAWPGGVLTFVLAAGILCAAYTEYLGIHSIFGAFIAGVAIGDSRHLRQETRETIHQFIMNVFAPIFFAGIGLRVSFVASFDLSMVLLVLVVALVGKVGGCYLGAKWAGMASRESLAVGMGMSARGAMEIILAQLARSVGLITDKAFVAIVIMALATSLLAGPAMQRLTQKRQRRRIAQVLSERQYVPGLAADTCQGAIEELSAVAGRILKLDARAIAEAAWQREQLAPTGLERGIAVPHARLANVSRPLIVIGRSARGVDFNASDGRPARLVCLIVSPEGDALSQLEMLDMIARAFSNPATLADARGADNYTQLLAALNRPEHDGAKDVA